ncbi:MAG: flagellar biosynthetic protein FliO [Thiotrichales bacterium]|nr:flagellar biosynthetic protein FliO [Thiotrichales bacterium]
MSRNCNDRQCVFGSGTWRRLAAVIPISIAGPAFAANAETQLAEPISSAGLGQVILGLLLVLAVIFVITWVLKRVPGFQTMGQGTMRIIDSMHVSPRERLLLVEIADQQLLLGVTNQSINTLHVLPEPVSRLPNQSEMTNRLVRLFNNDSKS